MIHTIKIFYEVQKEYFTNHPLLNVIIDAIEKVDKTGGSRVTLSEPQLITADVVVEPVESIDLIVHSSLLILESKPIGW